jgi:hypothetical protein
VEGAPQSPQWIRAGGIARQREQLRLLELAFVAGTRPELE